MRAFYNTSAEWVRRHFTRRKQHHHYDKPKIGFKLPTLDVIYEQRKSSKASSKGGVPGGVPFPGQAIQQLGKMPTVQNLSMLNSPYDPYSVGGDDDDDDVTNANEYNASRRGTEDTRLPWDKFRILQSDDNYTENSKCLDFIIQCLKVVAYIVTFLIVLGGSVISKSMLLLMTSQIRANRTIVYCKNEWDKNHQHSSTISNEERVAWFWCIAFTFIVPEFFTFFRSLRIAVFKSVQKPLIFEFLIVAFFEILHAIGISLFVFVVLPSIDVIKGSMIDNATCFIPAILLACCRTSDEKLRFVKLMIDLLAILAQLSGLVLWPVLNLNGMHGSKETGALEYVNAWAIPVSLLLISFGWWENYVDVDSPVKFVRSLANVKKSLIKTRYWTYVVIPILKTMVFLASMVGFFMLMESELNVGDLFSNFGSGFYANKVDLIRKTAQENFQQPDHQASFLFEENIKEQESTIARTPMYVCAIQIMLGLMTYITGKFACRICIQAFSYAFPINLTVPVTVSLLIAACGLRSESPCFLISLLPKYMYWECPNMDFMGLFIHKEHNWVWLLWLLSQTWVTLHIWTPKCERLASTETLYVTPMYSGILTDQSLALNRRRNEEKDMKTEVLDEEQADDMNEYYETIVPESEAAGERRVTHKSDYITKIYACATMWHETAEEMKAMLKSVLRLDEDQSARRTAQKYLKVVDPDYYELETHIFFDDAFEMSDENEDENVVNGFVKLLITIIDEAASNVHETNMKLRPPEKYPTPYGGRLIWTLPGKTKLYAHLKDKSKIRHRKRWSQVMYMYYLLGHRLMEQNIHADRKDVIATNTYILTLDGDIDFKPQAVQLLVDLMKKNHNLGAACGRIHPIGSGPMVWYQKFEYAIGHWLQKATEHMIGCVLCSPGCFSLFRAKGLMDDNVMARYTTTSDQARHYVQYDQGEDRWLCTLLLQRGYRVEYSAASDAYTHSPEGFGEFYNQRRRWVPSTMANILDLLMDSKKTIEINDNISLPYITYQGMLMMGTILGPGTIFLMLVGAFVAAFKIDNWTSFYANLIPIMIFIIVCFVAKPDYQILLAQIMSALYALIMMAVIVGISLQMREDGIGAPSFIFLVALSGSFFIAALLHPQEFWCIVPGFLYYLSIPSMYLFLILYSLCNLNIVSWGTREVLTKKTKQLLLSQILTAFYALVMMAVIVGTLLQVQDDGWTSPGTMFLIAVTSTFIIAGLVHPQEISCIFPGFLYYLLVPSMYLLLIIYSGINMFNVNWGTREVKTKKSREELEEEKQQQEEMKKKQSQPQIFNILGLKSESEMEGAISFNCANLCSFLFCTQPKSNEEQLRLIQIQESIKTLADKVENMHSAMENLPGNPLGLQPGRRKSFSRASHRSSRNMDTLMEGDNDDRHSDYDDNTDSSTQSVESKIERDDLINPYWIEDKDLKKGPTKWLPENEVEFWHAILEKYLHPIDENKEKKAQIQTDLKELRNKSVFAFFMFNALFVLIVFLLQLNKDKLYVEWPLGVKYNITYNEDTHEVRVNKEYLHLEPIGLVFVFFFALIIIIQFVAMMFHRFGTLSHILASTELNLFQRKVELSADNLLDKNAVEIVKNMQKLKGIDDDESEQGSSSRGQLGRRKTIHNIEKSFKKKQSIGTLDVAFRKRFFTDKENTQKPGTPILGGKAMNEDLRRALQERRDTVYGGDRQKMQTLGASNNITKVRGRHRNTNQALPLAGAFAAPPSVGNGSIRSSAGDNVAFENDDNEVRARSPTYQSAMGNLDSHF